MPKKPVRQSVYNKNNSVIRNNQFRKELKKILSLWPKHGTNKEIDSLAKKWGLPGIRFKPHTGTVSYKVEDNAVQVIPYKNRSDRGYIAEKTEHNIDEEFSSIPVVYVGSGKQKTMYIDHSPSLEDKRYLTLRIDLNEKKGVLMEQFEEKIDFYKKYAKQPKGRERESDYDLWQIYDLREGGKTYKEIIEIIDPTEDKDILLVRADVARKTYKKASEMVKAVKPIGR